MYRTCTCNLKYSQVVLNEYDHDNDDDISAQKIHVHVHVYTPSIYMYVNFKVLRILRKIDTRTKLRTKSIWWLWRNYTYPNQIMCFLLISLYFIVYKEFGSYCPCAHYGRTFSLGILEIINKMLFKVVQGLKNLNIYCTNIYNIIYMNSGISKCI